MTDRLAIDGGEETYSGKWPPPHVVDAADEIALIETLHSGEWSRGAKTLAFERAFAAFCGARHCLLVTNGTAALKLALIAAGVRPGDEVIVPGMTWHSVPLAVLECGAIPVPADIDLDTLGITASTVAAVASARTAAIVPTHLFSSQTDLPPLLDLASSLRITIIEDCAHAAGARRFGRALGTFGRAGIFSFNQKKLLSCGEGGCIVTNDDDLYAAAAALREVEPARPSLRAFPGTYIASEFQAAVLRTQLEKLPAALSLMETRAALLSSILQTIDRVILLPRLAGTDVRTWYNFAFRVSGITDAVRYRKALAAELGLPISGGYIPLSSAPALRGGGARIDERAERLAAALPGCVRAHERELVRFPHAALRAGEREIHSIGRAVAKVLRYL